MFVFSSILPFSVERVFGYHANPGALDRLIPPWESVRILKRGDSLRVGTEVLLSNQIGPIRVKWLARHSQNAYPHLFQDIQVKGPFRSWTHTHSFSQLDDDHCRLTDEVDYSLPFGKIGRLGSSWIRKKLNAMFEYRHETTFRDLEYWDLLRSQADVSDRPRVAISGSSGFLGSRLCALASVLGFEVIRILRSTVSQPDQSIASHHTVVIGDQGFDRPDLMEELDAVIHLGGYGIAKARWSDRTKEKILQSRVLGTRTLVEKLKELRVPPRQLVCASGIGGYGDQGNRECNDLEMSGSRSVGASFLEDVCKAWEHEAQGYRDCGDVAVARLGMVLHPQEGALAKMLPLFRFGLGGNVGPGTQYWSWIDVDDAIGSFLFLAIMGKSNGVYNVCSPEPVTNQDFVRVLAKTLGRPSWLTTPSFAINLGLGQMGKELLLTSTRGIPGRLMEDGYAFRYGKLAASLEHLLGVQADDSSDRDD